MFRIDFGWCMHENVEKLLLFVLLRACTRACIRSWIHVYVGLFLCVQVCSWGYVYISYGLRTWGPICVRGLCPVYVRCLVEALLCPFSLFFFNCFTSICNLNTFFFFFFFCCHFCIWTSPHPSFYLYSCIENSISQHFAWIKESNVTFFFHSPHLLLLVREAPIRWWSGTTFSFLNPGPIFGRRASSLSLDFFQRSPRVLPWCSALLRGGGILPTSVILLSGSWQWLPTTSTAWPALASKGLSSVWKVCRCLAGSWHVGEEVLHWDHLLLWLGVGLHASPTEDYKGACPYD